MGLLDSILNVACLLLWLNWRSVRITTPEKAPIVSLAATLKREETGRIARWASLVLLVGLLAARAVFYWNVGASANWTPTLRLEVVSLPFRIDYFSRVLLYSALIFGLVLGVFYAWMLLISVVNRNVPVDEPIQRLVRLQLGWVERWPPLLKALTPAILAAVLWAAGNPGLVRISVVPAPVSAWHLWQQSLLLAFTSLLSWKFLLIGLCLLYMVNSYVYLGNSPFWSFVNVTGANLLRPFRRFLCVGKFDLSPAVMIVLVLLAARWMEASLPWAFQQLPL